MFEGHFRSLKELYEKNELTNAVNRIVEDMNHNFTIKVLTQDFKSHDLGMARNNLRKNKNAPVDVLDDIDTEKVTSNLMKLYCKYCFQSAWITVFPGRIFNQIFNVR